MFMKNSYCSYCGYPFEKGSRFPRSCKHCHNVTYLNPIPCVITLVEIFNTENTGALLVRRAIEPEKGKLALPGGYLELGETWQEGAARELKEETGLVINPKDIYLSSIKHSPVGNLLIFTRTTVEMSDMTHLMQFQANNEVSELVLWWPGNPLDIGFPTHEEVIREAFGS